MGIKDLMVAGSREIFSRLGGPATYSHGGLDTETVVIHRENIQILGEFGTVVGFRDEVSLLLEDIPSPQRNAVVSLVNGPTLTLVEKVVRDGYYERWVVK